MNLFNGVNRRDHRGGSPGATGPGRTRVSRGAAGSDRRWGWASGAPWWASGGRFRARRSHPAPAEEAGNLGNWKPVPANTFGSVQVLMQIVFLCTALTFFEVPKVSLRIGAGVLV